MVSFPGLIKRLKNIHAYRCCMYLLMIIGGNASNNHPFLLWQQLLQIVRLCFICVCVITTICWWKVAADPSHSLKCHIFCSLRCNHFHLWHYKFMVSAGTFECISEKSTTNIIIRPYPFCNEINCQHFSYTFVFLPFSVVLGKLKLLKCFLYHP